MRSIRGTVALLTLVAGVGAAAAAGAHATHHPTKKRPKTVAPLRVTWMPGYAAPGTPGRLNKVGVLKIGRPGARNVLVLEPGTSAGSAYFVPLARWIVATAPNWQVWSVERRENMLEDQSEIDLAKAGKATARQAFNYYLGYLTDESITHHFQTIPNASVTYAYQWGLKVAIEDLHGVITAARRLGGAVVLGGHSLGGSVVTAYATWDFNGRPGADELAGLVYDDGGSFGSAPTAAAATQSLAQLQSGGTPWLAFSGVPAPYLGLFSVLGSLSAVQQPNALAFAQNFALLPASLKAPVPVTNVALFGYDTDTKTSKLNFASQAHLGELDTSTSPAGWSRDGAITPVQRYASMLSGAGVQGADGTEWYFPERLTIDTAAIDEGNANPAQSVFGINTTMGHELPRRLRIYAFGAYGGALILEAAQTLARQSHIPAANLTLVDRHGTYAHNDPAAAYPDNAFFNALIPFLKKIARRE